MLPCLVRQSVDSAGHPEKTYDNFGRETLDQAADPNDWTQVDGSVQAIATAYNDSGQTYSITSLNGSEVPVNQILYAYHGWGNVAESWQSHDGQVVTGGDTPTPAVTYGYDTLSRLTSVTYPTSGTGKIGYSYGAAGSVDNQLSRVTAITNTSADAASETNSMDFADYTYLGTDAIVDTAHPGVENGLDLTLGTAQNGYDGLDQWGRVVDQVWRSGGVNIDEYKYGYDAVGNVLWKQNAGLDAAALDELYSYDALNRLTSTQRGTLNSDKSGLTSAISALPLAQTWTLDGTGNWLGSSTNGVSQTRTVNAANEIQTISGTANPVTYDAAGNLTCDGTLSYKYDAWDRLVQVSTGSGEDTVIVGSYAYDGLNRQIQKTVYDGTTANNVTATTDYYYDEAGQILEARDVPASGFAVTTQYVWDLSYIDTPVCRIQTTGAGTPQVLYYMTDANHDVTGLVNTSGQVVERYVYSAYGQVTFCNANWTPEYVGETTTPVSVSAQGNEILYCGYRYDPETAVSAPTAAGATGNYQVRNREYSALLGQFAQRDPLGYAAGDDDLYRYCGNAPTDGTDPSGEADSGDAGLRQPIIDGVGGQNSFQAPSPTTGDSGWWPSSDTPYISFPEDPAKAAAAAAQAAANRPLTGLRAALEKLVEDSSLEPQAKAAAKADAKTIAETVNSTFNGNWKPASPLSEKCRGYFCYEWAYAFRNAVNAVKSKYFEASFDFCSWDCGEADPRVHYWTVVKFKCAKQELYVDDGFAPGFPGNVHQKPPQCYPDHPAKAPAEPESACDIPKVVLPSPPSTEGVLGNGDNCQLWGSGAENGAQPKAIDGPGCNQTQEEWDDANERDRERQQNEWYRFQRRMQIEEPDQCNG